MFIDLGFAVFDAYNGYHALALLERHPEISLLFVDVRRTRRVSAATTSRYQDRSHLRLRWRGILGKLRSLRAQALAGGPGCQSGWRMSGLRVRWPVNRCPEFASVIEECDAKALSERG